MDEDSFGPVDPRHNFTDLQVQLDRERGFFTESDRRYLLERHLEGHSARQRRQRIRERVLIGYFDLRFLRYVDERDKRQIFTKAREDDDLHLLNAVKEFIKFNHHALAETGFDFAELVEESIAEAEEERAIESGEYVDVDVSISIDGDETDTGELHNRFREGESLTPDELAALVSNRYVDVDLADALYHQARDLHSHPDPDGPTNAPGSRYTWEDPDEERAEEIHMELRRLFHDDGIETLDDFETAWFRYAGDAGEKFHDHRLHELVRELARAAPLYTHQMAAESSLSEADMERLHDIIWNPGKKSIEEIVRPWGADEDWVPSQDSNLQKFAARVENAAAGGFKPWGEEHHDRWEKFLDIIEFAPADWEEYIAEQEIADITDILTDLLEDASASADAVGDVEDYEELLDALDEAGADASEFDYQIIGYDHDNAVEAARHLPEEADE